MADDSSILNLPEVTSASASDVLVLVSAVGSLPETSRITVENYETSRGVQSHADNHKSAGSDAIKLDELASPTDTTTLNADTSKHGLFPKVSSTAGQKVITNGSTPSFIDDDAGLNVIIGSGAFAIEAGFVGFVEVPVNCEIEAWRVVGDAVGSIVIDVWKDTYANFPPTVADTISGSATKPTLSSAQKAENTTLTGWTKTLNKGDWLGFNVDSATTVKQVTLSLLVRKTATS